MRQRGSDIIINSGQGEASALVEAARIDSSSNSLALFIFTLEDKHFALDADLIKEFNFVPAEIDIYEHQRLFIKAEGKLKIVSLGYLFREKIEHYLKPRLMRFAIGQQVLAT